MIRRAVSRSAHPVRPANIPPLSAVDPDVEFRKRIAEQVEHLQEAIDWNDDLADEFDKIEPEIEIIRAVFDDETFPHEVLHTMISELMEQIPSLVERNERLQGRIYELRLVVTSWRGLVSDSLSEERFQIVEKATVSTGEVME